MMSSGSTYAYTGDYNELLYLRARYYAPSMGRFLTKDTWRGDDDRPLSLNRWNYVEGNPVNYADPAGHWIHPECQWMPTKGLYELCILKKYSLEPISYFQLGQRVEGQQGCYSGPNEYRAPGYLEGIEGHKLAFFGGVTGGLETVYDFATMQRSSFSFVGPIATDSLTGVGASAYVGKVLGFRTDTTVNEGYKGTALAVQGGISFDLVIGGGVGRGWFVSDSDLNLRGRTLYLGGSVSFDPLEFVDVAGSIAEYKPMTDFISYDADRDGFVEKKAQLFSDISSGAGSPWGIPGYIVSAPGVLMSRAYARYLAEKYVAAYEELR